MVDVKKLIEEIPTLAKQTAELNAALKVSELYGKGIKENSIAAFGYFAEVQKAQIEAAKSLGDHYNKELQNTFDLYKKLSKEDFLGVTLEQTKKAVLGVSEAFSGTGVAAEAALKNISESIASNSNVVESSKLIDFTKHFAMQTDLGSEAAAKFGSKLAKLSTELKRPPEILVELAQSLLNTGVLFGATEDKIARLTYQTERFGRAIGVSGKEVEGVLGGMMMIDQRQQLAARLSQIGVMSGADIDISKILSSDPEIQLQGVKDALQALGDASKGMPPPVRRALMLAISQSSGLNLSQEAIQAAMAGRPIPKAPLSAEAEKGIGAGTFKDFLKNFEDFRKQDRRKFATLSTRMAERATVAQLKLGETQLRTIGKILKIENADRMASIKLAQTMDTKLSAVSDKLVNLSGVVAEGVAKVIVKMLNILDDENLTFAKKTQEIKKLGDELTKLWDEAKKVRITP